MKLREIERLRAFAILMVVITHWRLTDAFLSPLVRDSWSGVDLFFVISGFVVTASLVRLLPDLREVPSFVEAFDRARLALKTFYSRRFFRIVPAAVTAAIAHRVLIDYFPHQFGTPKQWLEEFVAFLGGVYNYYLPIENHNELGAYWSLSVEEHFYLILPVLFVTLRTTGRRLGACVGVILLVVLVVRPFAHPEGSVVGAVGYYERFSSHLRFDSLMAGVALALLAKPNPGRPILPPWFVRTVIVPGCLLLITCLPGAVPEYVMHREGFIALWLLSGVVVAYASLDRGYVFSFPLIGGALEYLGSRSYALYLLHVDAMRLDEGIQERFPQYFPHRDPSDGVSLVHFLILFGVSLAASEVLHRVIEKPFMALGRRLVERARNAPAEPGVERAWRAAPAVQGACLSLLALYAFRHPIVQVLGPRNLALAKPVVASSHFEGTPAPEALTNGILEPERGLHTKLEDHPWAQIDLGSRRRIRAIRVYNRADGWQSDNLPLELSVSDDGAAWRLLARRERLFTQGAPWRIRTGDLFARYIRVSSPKKTTMCLSELEVFDNALMAAIP